MKSVATSFVALLRGINVGGKNLISMSLLRASFETMGFEDVSTYINSGNILFKSNESSARKLERNIEKMLSLEHLLECKVVVRSLSEMEQLVENLPEDWNDDKRWKCNVIFLRHSIDSTSILDGLHPRRDIEQVVYHPGALIWAALRSDLTRSTMLKLSSQKIYKDMTVRNLNTTRKLHERMKSM